MSSEESWEVEEIIGRRKKHGRYEYKIKWTGYKKTTWEPRENLNCPKKLRDFHDAINPTATETRKKLLQIGTDDVEFESDNSDDSKSLEEEEEEVVAVQDFTDAKKEYLRKTTKPSNLTGNRYKRLKTSLSMKPKKRTKPPGRPLAKPSFGIIKKQKESTFQSKAMSNEKIIQPKGLKSPLEDQHVSSNAATSRISTIEKSSPRLQERTKKKIWAIKSRKKSDIEQRAEREEEA